MTRTEETMAEMNCKACAEKKPRLIKRTQETPTNCKNLGSGKEEREACLPARFAGGLVRPENHDRHEKSGTSNSDG